MTLFLLPALLMLAGALALLYFPWQGGGGGSR
jgi:hypothetical protein